MTDPAQSYDIASPPYPNGSQSYKYRSRLPVDRNGAVIVSASPVSYCGGGYSCLVWSDANNMSYNKVRAIYQAAIGKGISP